MRDDATIMLLNGPDRLLDALPDAVDATGPGGMTAEDLAELIGSFNVVMRRLEATHDRLRAEVARLHGELSEANEQLERSRRLAALGQMAAGISHEIRNPLGSIRLYARMLVDDLAHQPEQRSIAGKIADAVRGLDGVVGDVLAFAKELRPRSRPIDVPTLFDEVLDACREPIDRGGIAVERRERVRLLFGDPDLLRQALVNLVRNAADAMSDPDRDDVDPPKQVVTLAAECVDGPGDVQGDFQGGVQGGSVRLTVADTGPGIPHEVLERMFNPFFTTRATGTGLGLAIVNRIAEAHGGAVRVEPRVAGGGAAVRLILPTSTTCSGGDQACAAAQEPMPVGVGGR